jgi:hypothetical protein
MGWTALWILHLIYIQTLALILSLTTSYIAFNLLPTTHSYRRARRARALP